jgi:hypothetical protein
MTFTSGLLRRAKLSAEYRRKGNLVSDVAVIILIIAVLLVIVLSVLAVRSRRGGKP